MQYGDTALHLAAQEGKFGVVELLIANNVQINKQRKVYLMECRKIYI